MEFSKPSLIEPTVKTFMIGTLKHCKKIRDEYYSYVFNLGSIIIFIIVLTLLLYYKYKGKLTPRQKKVKERKVQEYLISKLKMMEVDRKKNRQELITGLPLFKSEFDIMHRNLYR